MLINRSLEPCCSKELSKTFWNFHQLKINGHHTIKMCITTNQRARAFLSLVMLMFCFAQTVTFAQYDAAACSWYSPSGTFSPCPPNPACCNLAEACNGPNSPYYGYDHAYTGGCAMPSVPMDGGYWVLLILGAILGSVLISTRKSGIPSLPV